MANASRAPAHVSLEDVGVTGEVHTNGDSLSTCVCNRLYPLPL